MLRPFYAKARLIAKPQYDVYNDRLLTSFIYATDTALVYIGNIQSRYRAWTTELIHLSDVALNSLRAYFDGSL